MKGLNLQVACKAPQLPTKAQFKRWAMAALPLEKHAWELCIRLVDACESQSLNQQYRGKNKPTNVLSFPSHLPPELNIPLVGDLVLCAAVVAEEAHSQGKILADHYAHMVVHGCLHLLGYDHEEDAQAQAMEALEAQILQGLGIANPYLNEPLNHSPQGPKL